MLVVEALSLAAIFLLMIVTLLRHHGSIIQSQQFNFTGFSFHTLLLGMVLIAFLVLGLLNHAASSDKRQRIPARNP